MSGFCANVQMLFVPGLNGVTAVLFSG